ncbi:hypothetical protein EOD39_12770 [Acipenser ruthenus]|uniref:Uncharacterized protein n=1 Tax=Acipenser ruthenus TaxID=7906 RepID=A0A444UKE5_ACIRT|nr:hypothetical protein EOD39_12770 [Acipenser ruthenus]
MTIWAKVKGSATVPEGQAMVEGLDGRENWQNRRHREGELEQLGCSIGNQSRRIADKPANEKGCEEESQRTRTVKWSLLLQRRNKEGHLPTET